MALQAAAAQEVSISSSSALQPIIIFGRAESLLHVSNSASQGVVGAEELEQRPILRNGEVLETIPGVVITQHSGTGKANQYFLRGFNLDHGTDFATSVNGMPVNLPSHAHGQGYSDLNILIPELIDTVRFRKGAYDADQGDFSSAGSADIDYMTTLPAPYLKVEAGSYEYGRALFASTAKAVSGSVLYAVDLQHEDGPWTHPDDGKKANALLRYSRGDAQNGLKLTAMAYKGLWDATDQVAQRAIDEGLISRFGSLDTSDGGDSQRYSLSGQWAQSTDDTKTKVEAYAFYYDLHLFSNFTYFLNDPINGDQIEQKDRRAVSGLKASREWDLELAGLKLENTAGLQVRDDEISNGLLHTRDRQVLSVTRADSIGETSVSPYVSNKVIWTDWLRSVVGLRGDLYRFNVRSDKPSNSGDHTDFLASPKASLVFGPWDRTELYLDADYGFHSNDARGVTTRIDSASGNTVDPVTPLVRTKGAEVGARTLAIPGLQTTAALWVLKIGSELVFDGDAGTTAAGRPSKRYGVEWANFYSPASWLTLDADLSLSRARFTDSDPVGNAIPDSIQSVVATGVSLRNGTYSGELRLRYFGPRPLIEDNSVRSKASSLLYARLARDFASSWTVALEVFNLLNERANDIEYYYASRLPGEPAAGVNDIHLHPAEPRELRVVVTKKF